MRSRSERIQGFRAARCSDRNVVPLRDRSSGSMNGYALLHRVGFRGFMRAMYRIELVGAENVPAVGGCILASNHESIFDPFILGVATTREIRFMAKSELFENRVLASVLRATRRVPGRARRRRSRGHERGGCAAASRRGARHLPSGDVEAARPPTLASRRRATRPRDRHADRSRADDRHARVPSANARPDRGGQADRRRARASHRCRDERPHRAGRASSARRVVGTIPNRS